MIGTPGRLSKAVTGWYFLDYKSVEFLILDEADRILDLGFRKDVDAIIHSLPRQRRTGLFSATLSNEVEELIKVGFRNPVRIEIKVQNRKNKIQSTPPGLKNYFMVIMIENKLATLVTYLQANKKEKAIVFFLTCAQVDFLGKILPQLSQLEDSRIICIHGRMKQKKRNQLYETFISCDYGFLLCTDLVARGVDIQSVSFILQFDLPKKMEWFVHRVGRTARAGRLGNALLFLMPEERLYIKLLKLINTPIKEKSLINHSLINLSDCLKQMAIKDRDVMIKGSNAFISYLRAYNEYENKNIFSLKKLQSGKLATSMGLLRLPRLRGLYVQTKGYVLDKKIDCSKIKFIDKYREKQRTVQMKKKKEKKSQKHFLEKKSGYRQNEFQLKKERLQIQSNEKRLSIFQWNLLSFEENLHKKLKKRKITAEQLKEQIENYKLNM